MKSTNVRAAKGRSNVSDETDERLAEFDLAVITNTHWPIKARHCHL